MRRRRITSAILGTAFMEVDAISLTVGIGNIYKLCVPHRDPELEMYGNIELLDGAAIFALLAYQAPPWQSAMAVQEDQYA